MPLDLSRVKALCFDVDGTLSDTDELYSIRIARFLPRFLFRDPAHTARRLVMWAEAPGNALLGMADTLGLDDAMTAVIDWISRHRKFTDDELLLIPGVDVLLSRLHGRYPLAVVSARDEKATMRFLERFDLVKFFDVIVTGLSARHTKPYPDPILFAAQKMGVKPEECLMIGDTTVDMRAGKSAAAQTVGVLCGFGEEEELLRLGADYIVKNTADLADLLLDKK
ncbi:MAG TPA: HAD family hydrolase [Anaerolineales bacterium]|nr:HAD family hydrolase [Anaerolineales bacterium]